MIEGLCSAQAVGIISGEPKCGKSFLVSVATAPRSRSFIKSAAHKRPGLRGPSELHAWGDSNLYLTATASTCSSASSARIGFLSLLHTWGSVHPHVHMIVQAGGSFSLDGDTLGRLPRIPSARPRGRGPMTGSRSERSPVLPATHRTPEGSSFISRTVYAPPFGPAMLVSHDPQLSRLAA